jgi:hypothetical protein
LEAERFADAEFGTGEDIAILGEDGLGDIKAGGAGESDQEDSAGEAGGFEGGGDEDVGVED